MFNKRLISMVVGAAVTVLGVGMASARSVPALQGAPVSGAQAACFTVDTLSGAVISNCAAGYAVPASIDTVGNKPISFTSRATAAGAACRSVKNNRQGTAFAASPALAIPVAGVPVIQTTAALPITSVTDVLFLHCNTNAGTRLHEAFWTP
jgi:hypothetical protein